MQFRLSRADAAILHPRLLAEFEQVFGRPLQQGEAVMLVKLIRRCSRDEVMLRLASYSQAVQQGTAKPVTAGVWLRRHGAFWEVVHAA